MKKFKLDRSDIMSIIAILVSLAVMFVSLSQTTILKDQQEIMAGQ